jgi:hypothetical protein
MQPLVNFITAADLALLESGDFETCAHPDIQLAISIAIKWLELGDCKVNQYVFSKFTTIPKSNAMYLCKYIFLVYNRRVVFSDDYAAGAPAPLATCWTSTNAEGVIKNGRCRVNVDGGKVFNYILANKALYGDSTPGYQYHHRCRKPLCFRPTHVKPVPAAFNQGDQVKTCPAILYNSVSQDYTMGCLHVAPSCLVVNVTGAASTIVQLGLGDV